MYSTRKHIELTAAHIKKTDEYIESARAKLTAIKPEPIIFNGVNDITEKDAARQRYYQLYAEQTWWNIEGRYKRNKKQQENDAAAIATLILVIPLITLIIWAMVNSK